MPLNQQGTPALYTYDGIQYKAMETHNFSVEEMEFANAHIRILSGFYGILHPNTSIYLYRLEMQLKLAVGSHKNLYDYWIDCMSNYLTELEERDPSSVLTYVNLASKEYSKAIEPYMKQKKSYITCTFQVIKNGVRKVESTASKQARGAMVQAIVKNQWTQPEQLKQFDWNGYCFDATSSTKTEYVFIKE